MMASRITICFALLLAAPSAWAVPDWARNNATRRDGQNLQTVCSGSGPSVDIARGEAIHGCKASAAEFLSHSGRVQSLVTETSEGVDFHQSIEDSVAFKGLICLPKREQVESLDSGSISVWLLCSFDLSKATVGDETAESLTYRHPNPAGNKHLTSLRATKIKPATESFSKEKIVLSIASVPACTKLIVKGGRPRAVNCSSQPAAVVIFPDDEALVIEAKGYAPKTLDLRAKSWKNHDSVQVILDAH